MRFDETANGRDVEVPAGEEFDLFLPEIRTAGYRWTLKNSAVSTCALLSESSQPASGKAGGSGTHSWRFRAGSSGDCSLALEYKRSWEDSSEPARTFVMKVHVRP